MKETWSATAAVSEGIYYFSSADSTARSAIGEAMNIAKWFTTNQNFIVAMFSAPASCYVNEKKRGISGAVVADLQRVLNC